jgi:Predicted endonuclease distantly related to archaeal Holliday junction resolvase
LEAKGLRVLERNVVLGRLELDLVCEDGDTLVFVEVKTRAEGSLATPADGLTAQKRRTPAARRPRAIFPSTTSGGVPAALIW